MNPVKDDTGAPRAADGLDWLTGLGLVIIEERADGSARSLAPGRAGVADDVGTAIARAVGLADGDPRPARLVRAARGSGGASDELGGSRVALHRSDGDLLRVVIVPLDRTAASVVHELANALTGIAGWAQIATQSGPVPERVRAALDVLDRSSADALDTARTLLASIHALSTGAHAIEVGPGCDLADVVGAAIATMRPLADAKDVVIRARLPEGLRAAIRPAELRSIATNLIKNAVEALEPGGEIVVAGERDGGQVVLTVVDDGPGIDDATLAQVFDPWVSGKSGGTGLGLALVRDLARARGGDVRAESGRGRGARFVVRLPRVANSIAPPGGSRREAKMRSSGVRRRSTSSMRAAAGAGKTRPLEVLIVDDDEAVRSMVATALALRGARVSAVDGTRSAATLVAEQKDRRFDLALIDLSLRDGRGDQLVRWLRERRVVAKIVMTTGAAISPAESRGAIEVLRKPFAIEDLIDVVDRTSAAHAKARGR